MLYSLIRPLLFQLDPETAHSVAAAWLNRIEKLGLARLLAGDVPVMPRSVMGLTFPNPLGLAAGMDKNGEHIDAFGALGFGHIEVGTVTPRPQRGNPRPRLFRIPQAEAIINRMGFNNDGVDRLVENIRRRRRQDVLGISIGKSADTPIEDAIGDYVYCMRKVYEHAGYIAANISSPNTKDLRALQHGSELDRLLAALKAEQRALANAQGRYVPLAAKLAPDLETEQIGIIADRLNQHEIDAVIATNTTVARDRVQGLPHAEETGGLSGAPLTRRATEVIRQLRATLKDSIPIIGVGGIMSARDAQEKLDAGAALVQIYTGLIYKGPGLVTEILRGLRP